MKHNVSCSDFIYLNQWASLSMPPVDITFDFKWLFFNCLEEWIEYSYLVE